MRWLSSDWDHRDPRDDLHNLDDGKYLQALQKLPQSVRQLMEDSEMWVDVEEVHGSYKVTHVVKKREPEYNQGTDLYFLVEKDGTKVPCTEDEYEEWLGMEKNPEELFNRDDVEFVGLDHDQTAPMDVWDVLFSARDYLSRAKQLTNSEDWQAKTNATKKKELSLLSVGLHPRFSGVGIYSADWFPYSPDKRIRHPRAKAIAEKIQQGKLSRRQLSSLINNFHKDQRLEQAKELEHRSRSMKPSRAKAKLLLQAQALRQSYYSHKKQRSKMISDELCPSDKKKLWALWNEHEMRTKGSVKMPHWWFNKGKKGK